MGVAGGVSVTVGACGGLLWPAIESIGMLLIALLGAWSLLVGVAQRSDMAAPGSRANNAEVAPAPALEGQSGR
jgi:hypothetical protein